MDIKQLQPPLERQLSLLGFELVLLETARGEGGEVIRAYIDHLGQDRPVTLDDCVSVSDGLLAWLDVEFPSLREKVGIEVSSPGIERPLVTQAHFQRYLGRLCKVQTRLALNGQKRFKGWINNVSHEAVTLEEDGTLKQIQIDQIQSARLAPFDEGKAPKPKFPSTADGLHCAASAAEHGNAATVEVAADEREGAEKSAPKEA